MKRVCIHQPDFAPYLGFFHRLLLVDEFVVLDDVQFVKKGAGWTNRDKIKTPQGERWLTVSVEKGPSDQRINQVRLSTTTDWRAENLNMLRENYRMAPHFSSYFDQVEAIYRRGHQTLVEFNMDILRWLLGVLEVDVPMLYSSSIVTTARSNERLIQILASRKATRYLSGTGARAYMKEELFAAAGIAVDWQQFVHPVYPQLHGPFIPFLSVLDLVFNCGADSGRVLRSTLTPGAS